MQRNGEGDIWVFGYGSLMWNPGFPYAEVRSAQLHGYHRAFCLYSEHYRGTPERRGLVLGLDRGGSCVGRAFRVAAADAAAAMDYLIAREMFGHAVDVYALKWLRVALGVAPSGEAGSTSSPSPRARAGRGERQVSRGASVVRAACFVVNPAHDHYAGKLPPARIADIIAAASGQSGSNRDYLANTIAHLDELGIADGPLHAVHRLVSKV
ncbi:MAG: gamma-glutamylcyclotransferase [Alphaproteobacteria bacterium]